QHVVGILQARASNRGDDPIPSSVYHRKILTDRVSHHNKAPIGSHSETMGIAIHRHRRTDGGMVWMARDIHHTDTVRLAVGNVDRGAIRRASNQCRTNAHVY